MPHRGRGEIKRMAEFARIDSSYLGRIIRGAKGLKMEHAIRIARYLGLSPLESDYFVELARLDCAGNEDLRKYSERRLDEIQQAAGASHARAEKDRVLDMKEEAIFLSNWHYDAARIAAGIPGLQDVDAIAEYLSLPKSLVGQVVDFLLRTGLCLEQESKIRPGKKFLRLDPDSPMIDRHLLNWRSAAVERIPTSKSGDFFYTLPMAVAEEDADQLRGELKRMVEAAHRKSEQTRPEKVMCLNVDWFRV